MFKAFIPNVLAFTSGVTFVNMDNVTAIKNSLCPSPRIERILVLNIDWTISVPKLVQIGSTIKA